MASSEVMTSSTHSFAYSYRLVKKCFVKICETSKCHNFLIFQPIFIRFSLLCLKFFTLSSKLKLNLLWSSSLIITSAIDKRYWNAPSPKMASSCNRVACLYIIPTKILSISMTVATLGKFYQYKYNKGTNWPLYGNMQVMLSLGEGAFQCLLSIALVIKQWLTDDVTYRILVWKLFCGRF